MQKKAKTMCFILFLLTILPSTLLAQDKQRVDLSLNNATLKEFLTAVEKQTNYTFVYKNLDLTQRVTVKEKQASLSKVLATVFAGTNISYEIVNDKIILRNTPPREKNVNKLVVGTVSDKGGEPIIGVTIRLKGSNIGIVTDIDGKYSLTTPVGGTLIFSYVGYFTKEAKVTGDRLDVTLIENTQQLDEVIVVGYGSQKKMNLSGSVSTVDIAKLAESRPITNISTGLYGLVPGLYVRTSNNDPGGNAAFQLRGQGSLNSAAPLVIIDGVEGNIGYISPQDVATISVLKDAASASIYGSRAANGVMLITTKQAEVGKININYDGYIALQSLARRMDFVNNSVEYMELQNEAARNKGVKENFSMENIELWRANQGGDPLLWPNMDWMDATFRNSHTINHNISAQGGTDKIKSFMSFNYSDSPGIIENTGYKKYQLRLNTQIQLTSWLMVGANLTASHAEKERGSNSLSGMFSNAIAAVPTIVNRSPDGRYGGTNNVEDAQTVASPLWYMNQYKGDNMIRTFTSKYYFKLNPLKGLFVNGSYSYNFYDAKVTTQPIQNDRWNFQTNTVIASGQQMLYVTNTDARDLRNFMDIDASYERTVFKKLYFKVMLGASQEQYKYETFNATRNDLIDENLTQISAATGDATAGGAMNDWAMCSYFGRINLSWADKYLLEVNARKDGSSRFVGSNRWGTFPSASAAWRISEEPFMEFLKAKGINNLKIRASYGSLGNNAIGDYETRPVLSAVQYPLGNKPNVGYFQAMIANTNLKWESTYVTNFGIDLGLFDNRLNINVDAYDKDTKNILIVLPAPVENGYITIPKQNSARVRNRGLEVVLGWQDRIKGFQYHISGNFAMNKNKVLKFKGDEPSISGSAMIKEGLPINTQYLLIYDRIIQSQEDMDYVQSIIDNAPLDEKGNQKNPFPLGRPEKGDLLYADTNHDGIINLDDRQNVGNGQNPTFVYALSFGMSYKGFDLSCQMDGVGDRLSYFQNSYFTPNLRHSNVISREIADGRWYEGRTDRATYPRLMLGDTKNTQTSDFWLQSAAYLKIRNIQLGYSVPQTLLSHYSINRLRVYAGLENFFTFTKFSGIDPELSGMGYPGMKQVVFGINISL